MCFFTKFFENKTNTAIVEFREAKRKLKEASDQYKEACEKEVRKAPYISTPNDMSVVYDLWDIIELIECELKGQPKNKKEYTFNIDRVLDDETIKLLETEYKNNGWKRFECFPNQIMKWCSIVTLKR